MEENKKMKGRKDVGAVDGETDGDGGREEKEGVCR